MPATLTDICFNFTHSSFRRDEADVLQRAIDAGVTTLIVTGSSVEESQQGIVLAHKYPDNLYATAGVHPHLAKEWDASSPAAIKKMLVDKKIKAVGECGLDYNRDFSPRDKQRYAMEAQLELAVESGLPVFLHERDAHDDFIRILATYKSELADAVVHCFTGTQSQMEAYLELDCHIGITGWICDERRGHHLQDFVGLIPDNRLMVETDAPYLTPRNLKPQPRDRRNEPVFLPHICEAVARARGETPEQVAASTDKTAKLFFRLEN
ncbi:MAG TPA: hydrolase TatD [Chromatiales bacterium]|nr:hydrolase TatD [Thiotrichales bacterium]HIP68824.1 hydrolase TatD [Chromatiales bacterium]